MSTNTKVSNTSSNAEQINENIRGLKYNIDEILAFPGEKISNALHPDGKISGDEFIVTTKHKHEIIGNYDIAVPNAYQSITYPGALLVANQNLIEGNPQPLSTSRRPMEIVIDLPGLTKNNRKLINPEKYSSVLQGINEMINDWMGHNSRAYSIPANIQYRQDILYDKKSMALNFNCDVSFVEQHFGLDFKAIQKQEHSAYMVQFRQIFYTVSVTPPASPADVFSDNVEWKKDLNCLIDNSNPPAYVQNVQYGRDIYLLFESDMDSESFKLALDGTFDFEKGTVKGGGDAKYNTIKNSLKITSITHGGKPLPMNTESDPKKMIKQIKTYINKNMALSPENPALPLCYTIATLKDNKIALIKGSTEYITSTSEIFYSGCLVLKHNGAYVARFNVTWDELSYDSEYGEKITHKKWDNNGKQFTVGYSTEIPLPPNARNICIKAEGATGLAWEPWRTSINAQRLPLIKKRIVTISGTTLHQKYNMEEEVEKK